MKKIFTILFAFFLLGNNANSQVEKETEINPYLVEKDSILQKKQNPTKIIFNPSIGFGVGMLSYFGDLHIKNFQALSESNVGYEFTVSQALSKSVVLNFNLLMGKLSANELETRGDRRLNFQSDIVGGSLSMLYNFAYFLSDSRKVNPFLSVGIESFEFTSKTDVQDQNGNTYHYWSDGSIRNLDQKAANANEAIELTRDYTYESDVRKLNADNFGNYKTRAYALPIGVGAIIEINDYINFKLGTTMHFTFTDYIDGITFTSKGNRKGNTKYDNYLMTSCGLSIRFGNKKQFKMEQEASIYKNIDFDSLKGDDFDKDGVPDFKDLCQNTPANVPVDTLGCPLDDDGDNFPNYKDEEILSKQNSIVNNEGIEINEAQIEDQYNRYLDTSMTYAIIETRVHTGYGAINELPELKNLNSDTPKSQTTEIDPIATNKTDKKEPAKPIREVVKQVITAKKSTASKDQTYTIKRGDNLIKIAKNNGVSIEDLRKWNNITNDKIYAGSKIIVQKPQEGLNESSNSPSGPHMAASKGIYTVKSGDQLGTIANHFGCTISDLLNWNGLTSPIIEEGKKLIVKDLDKKE